MSFWDFVGGGADATLDKRKRDMAAQLQKDLEEQRRNFQMTLEQQRAERDFDKDRMNAESQRLERDYRREETAADRASREAERAESVRLREEELNFRKSDSAANRAESAASRKATQDATEAYRMSVTQQAKAKALNQEVSSIEKDIISTFGSEEDNLGRKVSKDLPNDIVVLLQEARDAAAMGDEEAAAAAINALRTRRYKPSASGQASTPITTGMQPR